MAYYGKPGIGPILHRKRLRAKNHDYSANGVYYTTICTINRLPLLGTIVDGSMSLNRVGEYVRVTLLTLPAHHPTLEVDSFVILPDHLHVLLLLSGYLQPCSPDRNHTVNLSSVVGRLKSVTSREYFRLNVKEKPGVKVGKLWQRGFYDRVIRNERELAEKREYIAANVERVWLRSVE